jgi:hypothetical protein
VRPHKPTPDVTLTLTPWQASTLHTVLTNALAMSSVSPTDARMNIRTIIDQLEQERLNK